jgi:hypothetical protein
MMSALHVRPPVEELKVGSLLLGGRLFLGVVYSRHVLTGTGMETLWRPFVYRVRSVLQRC